MELPNLKIYTKGKTSYAQSSIQLRKTFTSPLLDQYQKVAAKYKKYINDLGPIIGKVAQKENYRNYLKQQKLNMIKSHLAIKKEQLQKQLEEKLDPIKSPNGKLHVQITSLHELETNYNQILAAIENNIEEKRRETAELQACVSQQKSVIKELLKYNFKEKTHQILPKMARNESYCSLKSNDSSSSPYYKQSRQSMISKLGESIKDHTNQKLTMEQQKLIMLKLFIVYYKSTQLNQTNAKLIQSIEKEVIVREDYIKQVKKQMTQIQLQGIQLLNAHQTKN